MLAGIDVTEKSFGTKRLMDSVKFSVEEGEKVGIIGRNGVGKSTLFGILTGEDKDFAGDVKFRRGTVVVATAQEHHGVGTQTVMQYILHGLPEYAKLRRIIDEYPATMGSDMHKITEYTEALGRFEDKGFYQIEEQVARELATFQLGHIEAQEFATLSGGQKRLVEVIKIMHSQAQLALMDEPTNHMDYVAKAQFINWMQDAREAMLIISHDRDVLREVDKIVELKDGGAVTSRGNYDAYLRQNAQTTGAQMNEFELIEKRIKNLKQKVIDYQRLKEKSRNPGTIQKFKRLEGEARKELAELSAKEKPTFWIDKDSAVDLHYKTAEQYDKFKAKNVRIALKTDESRSKKIVARARNLSLGYDTALFADVDIDLRESEALELRGRNGAGKTTLIKALLGSSQVQTFAGELVLDANIRVGVYEQEVSPTYFTLTLRNAIERMHLDRDISISETKIRKLMSDYLFNEGDGATPVSRLSGGQKARFQLITMLANDPQLLILDEPTNHLDLPSIEELETALSGYTGAILYVSHDSYFRSAVGGEVIQIG